MQANPLLTLAVVLTAGFASGELARRARLPAVTGQILAGILMGPSILAVFSAEEVEGLHPITHFALGLIAVAVGNHLNLVRLRNAMKRLAFLALIEATLMPLAVFALLLTLTDWTLAALLAAMSVSTAPATVLAVVKETRSKGVFVKTLMAAVALNSIACICLFEVARILARQELDPQTAFTAMSAVLAPLQQLAGSALLGGAVGLALVIVTRRVVRSDKLATASITAILLTSGLAGWLGLSSLLSCTFLGVALSNLTPTKNEIGHAVFADFESAIFAVFFTLAGMELDFGHAAAGGLLAALLFCTRILGKEVSSNIAMRLAGATEGVRRHLGLALVPQAGVAVGLLLLVREDPACEPIHDLLLAVGLTVVTLNEIVGPILTRAALARSGDLGKDRARLIDFIHEENIVTDLEASTKEEAVRRLTEVLVSSNHLAADSGRLLESILEREREVSTCFGGGLAVPHGEYEGGERMVGAMGISRRGLDFDTPDGRPVHCMVVLATPPDQRDRHLEILAALAHAVGTDPNVQQQLFNAQSPAHAYEILHTEEAEDFNYFLE